ncbi:MAG: YdeI/OmpD-associated family protein [Terracidiphilus sp.]
MNKKNPIVDRVLQQETRWQDEFQMLRTIVLGFPLAEELKWGQACYTLDGKNVVLIHGFKEYCALMFFKGALLKDPHRNLATSGQNQATRQIRFTSVKEITRLKPVVKACIQEAMEVERAGLKVKMKKTEDFAIPDELQKKLDAMPALKKAFYALTPGRQRGYIFHFSQPKLAKTREARVEKSIALILAGKGLND